MKHIDITPRKEDGLATIMVTQESNNFGDQLLTLKKLNASRTEYKVIAEASLAEGDWMDTKHMRAWYERVNEEEFKRNLDACVDHILQTRGVNNL